MTSFNKCYFIGNVVRAIEVHYTPAGCAVAEFSIAVNRRWKVDGEQREETAFVDCVAWEKVAEIIGKYVAKGDPVFVETHAETQRWNDKTTGNARSRIRFSVDNVQFLGARRESQKENMSEGFDGDAPPF